MPKGVRYGGRQKGAKNKATLEREREAVAALTEVARKTPPVIGRTALERQVVLAEGMTARYQRVTEEQAAELRAAGNPEAKATDGDPTLYMKWFEIWHTCAKELTSYQAPKVKAVDAPAPPPDPNQMQRENTRRFGLRVFEGGKPLPAAANDAA